MEYSLQTVAAMACMKSLLMVFNFIFWLSGIIIIVIGVWLEVDLYQYMEMSTNYSSATSYFLIGTGVLIFLVGSFACCCTLKGNHSLLYIYGSILAAIFILELGCGISIYTYRDKLSEGFDSGMTTVMKNYHNNTQVAEDFDTVQETLKCCGNHQPSDWKALKLEIPTSCCKEENCNTNDESQIYEEGCYEKVINFLNSNISIVAIAAICLAVFPLVGVLLSCCLASSLKKHKYEQMA